MGNRITHTDFNGATHSFTYEANNDWLLNEQYADGKTISYTYNAIGQRLSATDSQGSYGYTYDTMDRLTLETKPNGDSIGYGYDANGSRTSLTTTVNNIDSTATYAFDELNRMSSVTDSDNRTTGYSYDENSNQTHIAQANGTSSITTFDELNRITDITHRGTDNSILLGLGYTLDPTGRRTAITESTGRESTYTYDTLYRLTGDAIVDPVNGNHNASYEYDEVGNRIYETINGVQTQYIIDNNDRLSQQGGTSYQYDDNGNTISETLDGITTSYCYDSRNRLVATDKGGAQIDMAYDPDGIRVQKIVDGEATDYLVDSNRAYAQVLVEQTGATELGYTFGTDLVGLDTGSESYSYQTDALGSTRLLSNGSGVATDDVVFDAWGNLLAGGTVAENHYLYTGEQFDDNLDQYYLRARYMDTNLGRFSQMDEWRGTLASPISQNKFLYTSADPLNLVDPSGEFGIAAGFGFGLGFGVAIGGAITIKATSSSGTTAPENNKPSYGQIGWLVLATLSAANSSLFDLIDVKVKEKTKSNSKCGRLYGPYYRYEDTWDLVIQANLGWLYGTTPAGGLGPTVEAFGWKKGGDKEVEFCTAVAPASGGKPNLPRWYAHTPNVYYHDDDTVKIRINRIN